MVFRCPNIAGTTRSTHYSRTELRELLDPDNTSAKADSNNWTPEQGGWLRAKLRVDHVSTTGDAGKYGRVIIGQIHGPVSEPVRSEERRVGKAWASKCRSRWPPSN